MAGNLTFEALGAAVKDGVIDTVLTCFPDMQGRLMGKRFHAANFVETSSGKRTAATTCWPPTWKWRRRTATPPPVGNAAMVTM